jgi:N-methylhydantoinase A
VTVAEEVGRRESRDGFSVGVDVGGTHTDLILATPDGLVRSKALTTHGDYSRGILEALSLAAEQAGSTLEHVLESCQSFVNGTTIVTNVLTEMRGAKVGVLITNGFRDTFRIAGGMRRNVYDDHAQRNPQDIVERACIEEVDERALSDGSILKPIDEDEVRAAIRRLRDRGVEAIAVCYLWSFLNPCSEQQTREIIAEEFPEAFVTLSSEVHPVIREFERFMTAVFNCLSYRATSRYVDVLGTELSSAGFHGSLTFFQGIGGSVHGDVVRRTPIKLLASGPAGGVMGARDVAARMGIRNVLVGDMGGTSFDTAVLEDLGVPIARRATFDDLATGISLIDIVSIGAGGGSIAAMDARGIPQVGPHSAGSEPGPACYGRGGTEPTVTDAMLTLGFMDPPGYLGGRYKLDAQAAAAAIRDRIAVPLACSVEEAAAGIHDIAVVNMTNALREVTVERGHDPRDFTMFAYGGTLPFFAVQICRRLGCPQIVIPDHSAAFSAYGVLMADYVRNYDQTVQWALSDVESTERVNAAARRMYEQAMVDAAADGIDTTDLQIERTGDFRFMGQVYEVTVPLPDADLQVEDAAKLAEQFVVAYERAYGEGTAWKGTPAMMVTYSIRVTYAREKPSGRFAEEAGDMGPVAPARHRDVFLPDQREWASIPIYDDEQLAPGASVSGPSIVALKDTTIFLPADATARRTAHYGFLITTDKERRADG